MSRVTYQIKASVPIIVRVTDDQIFCNSVKGYLLYAVNDTTGDKRLVEDYTGATIKENAHTRQEHERWLIEPK